MHIRLQSPTQLVLRNAFWTVWLAGLICLASGLAIFNWIGRHTTLSCTRIQPASNRCVWLDKGPISENRKTFALIGARVDVSEDSDSGDTYRVVLQTSGGDLPFTGYYSSGQSAKQKRVAEINTFIQDTNRLELNIVQDDRLWAGAISALLVGSGFFAVLFFGGPVTYDFDRARGLLVITKARILGSQVHEYFLAEIVDVQLQTSQSDSSNTYRVALGLRDGGSVPLTSYYSSGRKGKEKLAGQIRAFLNLRDGGML